MTTTRSPIPAEFAATGTDNNVGGATEKQQDYAKALLAKLADRDIADRAQARYDALVEAHQLTKAKASEIITWAQAQPQAQRQQAQAPAQQHDVPAGRYAVDTEEGHLAFYRVDRPTEGKWAGYTFVKVQASDELHRVRGQAAKAVLAKIAVDPQAAMLRYGQEIGECGHCGRTLTDETSRARGIGPVCAGHMGL